LLVVPQEEEIGGVAAAIGNLANYLRDRGHDVFFFHPAETLCLRRRMTKLGFRGFRLRLQMPVEQRSPALTVPVFVALLPILLLQLLYLLWRYRIQVINVHYPVDRFVYFAVCRSLLPVSLITSIHGADVFPNGTRAGRYSRWLKFLLATTDRIVAPSKRFRDDFLNVFPELAAKTTFIHHGVNLHEMKALCGDHPIDRGSPYILCISAYKEQKALDVLIRAFPEVSRKHPSIRLTLVGAGHLRREMETLARSLGIGDRVEFLGPKSRREVAQLLRGCEVFVLPSRSETFGIVILEAMAYEKPIVATSVGGIPEIIESGKNGVLVEPDDPAALSEAITAVLDGRELKHSIARNGYRTVERHFRNEYSGSAYEAVFARS
jgi:glycosyltransferase involved in cell wall biosynthesis